MIDDRENGKPQEHASQLTAYRCGEGHVFLYPHGDCPVCGTETREANSLPGAKLISQTVVRVSPTGRQFRLGLAETAGGAKTLCIIDDGVSVEEDEVIVYLDDGLYHVKPRNQG
jgi:uncharacterized OB-fold protein